MQSYKFSDGRSAGQFSNKEKEDIKDKWSNKTTESLASKQRRQIREMLQDKKNDDDKFRQDEAVLLEMKRREIDETVQKHLRRQRMINMGMN